MTLLVVVGLRAEARIAAAPGLRVVVGGGRPEALQRDLERVLRAAPACGVLSFGVAGALDPSLGVGALLLADRVTTAAGESFQIDSSWRSRLFDAVGGGGGALAGADEVVAEPSEKQRLRGVTGAVAVDMESHIAARAATAFGLPFAALRVISDRADQGLPRAATVGLRADGGVDVAAVLRRLARAPGELPGLVRTGLDARRAFQGLARARRAAGAAFSAP